MSTGAVSTEEPAAERSESADPDYDEDGVDRSLIRWMLALTPTERVRAAEDFAESAGVVQGVRRSIP